MKIDNIKAQHIAVIPVGAIIAPIYQRPIDNRRVARIIQNFDVAKLGLPLVSEHEDGSYTILDGQHRIAALRSMNCSEVRCIVLKGLTIEQEADYFRTQGVDCCALSAIDKYLAGVTARDPHYLAIQSILDEHSLQVTHQGGPGTIAAVESLSRIAMLYSFRVLDLTVSALIATWPADGAAVRREMLAGTAEFMSRFGNDVTPAMFAKRMVAHSPSKILYDLQAKMGGRATSQGAFSLGQRNTLCALLMDCYNKGLPKAKRILMWELNREEA